MPIPAVLAAAIAGGALSAGSSLLNTGINSYVTAEENRKARQQESSMLYSTQVHDYRKLHEQMDFEKEMFNKQVALQNSAYQRAIADMEKAGINPASLAGVDMQPAYTPSAGAMPSGGSPSSGHAAMMSFNGARLDFGSEMFNSAISSMLAKDRDAAKYVASEMIDNARHVHRMEELNEKHQMDLARDYENNRSRHKYQNEKEAAQADYYSAMANSIVKKNK